MRKLMFNTVNHHNTEEWEHVVTEANLEGLDIDLDMLISNLEYKSCVLTYVTKTARAKYTSSVRPESVTSWCVIEESK